MRIADFPQSIANTVIERAVATIVTVTPAAPATHAFASIEFAGQQTMFYPVLATIALMAYATLVPLYRLMSPSIASSVAAFWPVV